MSSSTAWAQAFDLVGDNRAAVSGPEAAAHLPFVSLVRRVLAARQASLALEPVPSSARHRLGSAFASWASSRRGSSIAKLVMDSFRDPLVARSSLADGRILRFVEGQYLLDVRVRRGPRGDYQAILCLTPASAGATVRFRSETTTQEVVLDGFGVAMVDEVDESQPLTLSIHDARGTLLLQTAPIPLE